MAHAFRSPTLAISAVAVTLALALSGCGTAMIDQLPAAVGGEPAGLPARPKTATYQYPAVHDMPPTRSAAPLSDNEQIRMEKDLESARDRQVKAYGPGSVDSVSPATAPQATPDTAAAASGAKKKKGTAKSDQNSGAKTNP